MTAPFDDTDLEELLGAYALDACEPERAAAIDLLFVRRPDLAREAARLADAAVWIGGSEALEPPASLRRAVFAPATLPVPLRLVCHPDLEGRQTPCMDTSVMGAPDGHCACT